MMDLWELEETAEVIILGEPQGAAGKESVYHLLRILMNLVLIFRTVRNTCVVTVSALHRLVWLLWTKSSAGTLPELELSRDFSCSSQLAAGHRNRLP